MIVDSSETITLIGAGSVAETEIDRCRRLGKRLVAADGGARLSLEFGHAPEVVIGDMDSLGDVSGLDPENVHLVPEQDSTDFDKALRNIAAPLVLGVGFTGARVDHQLACYNVLVRRPEKRCVLLSDTDIAFLAPPKLSLELPVGTRVSLFPFGAVTGQSQGLRWPIQGLHFKPDGQIGTSNEAIDTVTLCFDAPKMLVILPESALETVTAALLLTPEEWPAL